MSSEQDWAAIWKAHADEAAGLVAEALAEMMKLRAGLERFGMHSIEPGNLCAIQQQPIATYDPETGRYDRECTCGLQDLIDGRTDG